MKIEELVPIVYKGERVLTSKQVAELYEVSPSRIKDNFRKSKKHFQEGEHYFKIAGEVLHDLKEQVNEEIAKLVMSAQAGESFRSLEIHSPLATFTHNAILYTAQGCARHCKMLNTETAWRVFSKLEKAYFDTQTVLEPVQSSLPLPEPVEEPAIVDKACVYVFRLGNDTTKIGVTADLVDRARGVERSSGSKVVRIHNSDFVDRELALKLEKALHNKFSFQRLEGEFFSVTFEAACRELERCLAELHLFEPLALPDVDLADKLLAVAAGIQNPDAKDKILIHAANLLVGQDAF